MVIITSVRILNNILALDEKAQHPTTASFLHAGRKNNWPPLPEKFPVGPCFYHDIAVDIPVEFQKTVKIMYNLWMCKCTI